MTRAEEARQIIKEGAQTSTKVVELFRVANKEMPTLGELAPMSRLTDVELASYLTVLILSTLADPDLRKAIHDAVHHALTLGQMLQYNAQKAGRPC